MSADAGRVHPTAATCVLETPPCRPAVQVHRVWHSRAHSLGRQHLDGPGQAAGHDLGAGLAKHLVSLAALHLRATAGARGRARRQGCPVRAELRPRLTISSQAVRLQGPEKDAPCPRPSLSVSASFANCHPAQLPYSS